MENPFAENLRALKRHAPNAEEILLSSTRIGDQIELFDAGGGNLNLDYFHLDGRSFTYHRNENPRNEIVDQLQEGWERCIDLLIVVGAGLCHQLLPLLERTPRAGLIVVEPFPLAMAAAMQHVDFTPIFDHPRIRVLLETDTAQLSGVAEEYFDRFFMPAVEISALESCKITCSDLIHEFNQTIAKLTDKAGLRIRSHRSQTSIPLENILVNISRAKHHGRTTDLDGCAAGTPAVIVSSGPSLDKNGFLLPAAAERAVLLATASSTAFLDVIGLEPDAVLAADPNPVNRCHLNRRFGHNTLFIYDAATDPMMVRDAGGEKVIANCGHALTAYMEKFFGRIGFLQSWGSISTSAFDLALRMGCDPIVFVGLDQALGDGRRPHFLGYRMPPALPAEKIDEPQPVREAIDIFGGTAETTPVMLAYRTWIEERAGRLRGTSVINATEGGIVSGMEQRSLRDLVNAWSSLPKKPALHHRLARKRNGRLDAALFLEAFNHDISVLTENLINSTPTDFPYSIAGLELFSVLRGLVVDELLELERLARTQAPDPDLWAENTRLAVAGIKQFRDRTFKIVKQELT